MSKSSIRIVAAVLISVTLALPAAAQWTYGPTLNQSRAGAASAVSKNGKIFVVGGNIIADPDMTGALEVYDPLLNSWSFRAPMPTPRTSAAAATALGKLFVFGGCPESHGYGGVSTVEVYDPATDSWSTATPMSVGRTGLEAVTAKNGRIYVIGGHAIPGGHVRIVEIYDPATDTWSLGAPMPTARQQFGATLGPDGKIYVVGGSDQWRGGIMTTVEVYDPVTDSWETRAPMPTKRDGVGVIFGPDGKLYAAGGWTGNYPYYGDLTKTVEIYDPASNSWTRGPDMLQPEYSVTLVPWHECHIAASTGGGYGATNLVQVLAFSTSSRFGTKCR